MSVDRGDPEVPSATGGSGASAKDYEWLPHVDGASARHHWDGLDSREAYRALAEGVPAILYIDAVDELSTNLYTSPWVSEILGYTPEEWMSRPTMFQELLHPDDFDRVTKLDHESNVTGDPFRVEYRMIARDGHVVWIRDEAVIVRDERGTPLFWRGVMLDITEQKRAEERLRHSLEILRRTMDQRRALMARLEEAQEEERRRIAADIHDDPIQVMSAADVRIQQLAETTHDEESRISLSEVHTTVARAVERLRHLLFELRPPALSQRGLVGALELYLSHVGREASFEGVVQSSLSFEPTSDMASALFRIAQEALTNVRKHAGAAHVEIAILERDGGVLLRVSDDGRGFDPSAFAAPQPGHLGISAMPERAELAGGWFRLQSTPGEGTTVECWVPSGAGPDVASTGSPA